MPPSWLDNINSWASNYDIDNYGSQLELAYPYFLYIPASPIDYDTITDTGTLVSYYLTNIIYTYLPFA